MGFSIKYNNKFAHGDGTTKGRDGAGTRQVHRRTTEDCNEATEAADAGGLTLRGSATGRAETATAGAASERVGLRGDLAASGQEGDNEAETTGADGYAEARQSHSGQPEGRQETVGGGGGIGGINLAKAGSAER